MNHTTLAAALAAALLGAVGCGGSPGAGGGDGDDDAQPNPDAGVDSSPDAYVPLVPPDIDGRITINEFMTTNALTIKDEAGAAGDWIELYNPTDRAIALQGYGITDELAKPLKFKLPAGVTIAARSHLILWADDRSSPGPTHIGFKLAKATGELGLARPDGTWIDRLAYTDQETDFSAAREPDGSSSWKVEWKATPGAANLAGTGQPMGLEVATTPPEVVPPAGDLSERILGYDVLLQIGLEVSPEGVAALETSPFVYVPGFLVLDGRRYGPVGVRCKGVNSYRPFSQKPSLRINIEEYTESAKFFGLKDLTLNNMHNDFSMMHERLAYLVARRAEIPASRANHALLTVNGQPYGLYTNVETVKRNMLERWFADTSGTLFEATDVDLAASYIPQYELELGPDNRTQLTGAANALTLPDPDQAIAAAGQFVDMPQFQRFWAMASVVAQFDAWPYSIPGDDIFVYVNPANGRLVFMPWGMDETFYSAQLDVTNVYSVLARRCRESAACFQGYVDQVWSVLAVTEAADMAGERTRIANQIRPFVEADTRKAYTTDQVLASQGDMYWFFAERRQNLGVHLPPPSPSP